MIKKTSLFIFLFFSCNLFISAQTNDWKERGLVGPVKSIREISYIAGNKYGGGYYKKEKGDEYSSECVDVLTEFNTEGYITREKYYYDNREICRTITYKYRGNKIKKIFVKNYKNTPEIKKGEYLWKEYFYLPNGKIKQIKEYNVFGNEITGPKINAGDWLSTKKFFYDDKGKLIKVEYDHVNAEYYYLKLLNYDDKGRLKSEIWNPQFTGSEGFYSRITTYFYNGAGQLKRTESKYNSGDRKNELIEEVTYVYKNDDNLVEKIVRNSRGDIKEKIKYDAKGNIIEDSWGPAYVTKYKYYFDPRGNWIKKILFRNRKAKFIVERRIEYYKVTIAR